MMLVGSAMRVAAVFIGTATHRAIGRQVESPAWRVALGAGVGVVSLGAVSGALLAVAMNHRCSRRGRFGRPSSSSLEDASLD